MKRRLQIPSKEYLYKEYTKNKKGIIQIAKEFGCCYAKICIWLHKYNIYVRKPLSGKKLCKLGIQTRFKKGHPSLSIKGRFLKGKNHPQYGKPLSNKLKRILSKIHKGKIGRKHTTIEKRKIGIASQKMWSEPKRKEIHKQMMLNYWKNPKFVKKILNRLNFKPNKPETFLLNFLKLNKIYNFKYVGNGKFWFIHKGNHFNPDFIDKINKKIIEFFGIYWHGLKKNKVRDIKRLKAYKKYGYKVLILNENDLKNEYILLKKILNFNKGK